MTPNIARHDPRPEYLRALVKRTGISHRAVARRIGVSDRMLRYYLSESDDHRPAPYVVQFALEALARKRP